MPTNNGVLECEFAKIVQDLLHVYELLYLEG
jgi:hypothetical protein